MRKSGSKNDEGFEKLRNRAEESLRKRSSDPGKTPLDDPRKLIHELRVHQIELEMQNEELRNAQLELAQSRDRYFELYDFAPIGYFTLDERGLILSVNLAGADLLGSERASLMRKRFSQFVAPGSQDAFYSHSKQALEIGSKQVSDLELKRKNGEPFYAQIQSVAVKGDEGHFIQLRTAVVDITQRKRAEWALADAHNQLERKVVERTNDLLTANAKLEEEIEERKEAEAALQRSQSELETLSSRLLTVQEDERKAIALDLHDTISQNLAAIKMFLEVKEVSMRGGNLPGLPLQKIISLAVECMVQLRRIIDNLRPAILDDLGIIVAVNRYCAEFEKIYNGVRIKRDFDAEEKAIPTELRIVIFRILQEALNNVAKHSGAKNVEISVRKREGRIELGIKDDGAGFEERDTPLEGLVQGIGLGGMRERARLSGGSISIHSRKGEGTTIAASWPC